MKVVKQTTPYGRKCYSCGNWSNVIYRFRFIHEDSAPFCKKCAAFMAEKYFKGKVK